jgi:hypothetical protein
VRSNRVLMADRGLVHAKADGVIWADTPRSLGVLGPPSGSSVSTRKYPIMSADGAITPIYETCRKLHYH